MIHEKKLHTENQIKIKQKDRCKKPIFIGKKFSAFSQQVQTKTFRVAEK